MMSNDMCRFYEAFLDLGKNPIVLAASVIALVTGFVFSDLPVDPAWLPVFLCGLPIIVEASVAMVQRFDVKADLLVSVAIIASVCIGEVFAAGTVAVIMQLGGFLEDRTVAKANRGVERLTAMRPAEAHVIRDGEWVTLPVAELVKGDRLRVLAGETVPADGHISSGHATVDQSIVTGESLPADKGVGDEVFGGTVSTGGAFEMTAERVGDDATIGRMAELIRSADPGTAEIVRAADRWATWIVVVAMLMAIGTYAFTGDIRRSVTILVVFCPCSFILATPTAVVAAIGNAAKHGVLVRRGDAFERMASVDGIVFDKTGTLTEGRLRVAEVLTLGTYPQEDIHRLAASVESMSEHPVGKAIVGGYAESYPDPVLQPESFEAVPGRGVSATVGGKRVDVGNMRHMEDLGIDAISFPETAGDGRTAVYLAVDGIPAGIISMEDTVRTESKGVISSIRDSGVNSIILTGDGEGAARAVAEKVGADDVVYRCLPEDKLRIVRGMESDGGAVCMVGDGVNDAAALKAARIGVAMGLGSDIAIESSDMVLSGGDLSQMPHMISLSRRVLRTIRFNLALAMAINVSALVMAMAGLMGPISGAIVHNAGSVAVMLASATLLVWGENAEECPSETVSSPSII